MFGSKLRDVRGIRADLREMGERSSAAHLFIRKSECNLRQISREDGLRHAVIGDSRDDPAASPLLHFGNIVLEVARRDVENPGSVMSRVTRDPTEKVAAKTPRSFYEQRDPR